MTEVAQFGRHFRASGPFPGPTAATNGELVTGNEACQHSLFLLCNTFSQFRAGAPLGQAFALCLWYFLGNNVESDGEGDNLFGGTMSAAVCLLASLLICPYSDTGARLRPSTEHAQSIKRERLGNPPAPPAVARFGPDERDNPPPPPAVARFGPDERFGTTAPQIPITFIFSKVDENQKSEDQEPREKKRKKIKVASVDKPRQKLNTRTKIVLKTTETETVETAYSEPTPLREQWRLSSLFGIRNAADPTLSQPISGVTGIDMGKLGYQEVIRAAKIHQVPVALALRVAKQESRGDCGAQSSAGALGVMQVMPKTGAKHGYSTKQLTNCRTGAEAGVKELKHLLSLSGGDVKQTLTGYNCGENCMFGRRKNLPSETVNYIQIVTRN